MAWWAVYDSASGRLLSVGTVLPDPLPEGHATLPLVGPPSRTEQWNEVSRQFTARPVEPPSEDRRKTLAARPDLASIYAKLTTKERENLDAALLEEFGASACKAEVDEEGKDLLAVEIER